jgi:hypothetical protein
MIDGDCIPVAFALTKAEKIEAHYKCDLGKLRKHYPNSAGWKFAHIEDVGMNSREDLPEIDISKLKDHFRKMMSPSNMFVVRNKEYGGLAELPEFKRQFKSGLDRLSLSYGGNAK